MVREAEIEAQLSSALGAHKKALTAFNLLSHDNEVSSLLEQANTVSIKRMGFNDHGRVHAKIVALNAVRMYQLLQQRRISSNIVREGTGDDDDGQTAIVFGSYLHDIGISVSRDSHDILGAYLAKDIVRRVLPKVIPQPETNVRMTPIILEEIMCHLGHYRATSLEAKIVAAADGTDMTRGRARIPYRISEPNIHKFSALAVDKVEITSGQRKPIRITAEMSDTAGIFQVEYQLIQKITDVGFDDYVEIVAKIKGKREVTYLA